ncbi:MAG: ATP-grasp domain-containing protein [Bacteroidales bacterium]|nr:ATP-grasp domain-containing protein [Bacteroidales bacterium]
MNKCDVIVTYCWNRVGYNILRSLSAKGLKVWVADTSKINICSSSKFCAGSFIYPDPFTKEEEFIRYLIEKVDELKPKMLLPTHDESQVIMRHRAEFPQELIIPYMDAKSLVNLSDKAWATEKAAECGVPIPMVFDWTKVDRFPCVFKTVIGNSAKTVFFPKNQEELEKLVYKFREEKTLIEEWIGGTDYSVDCVRWDGFFQATTYHALMTKTDGGGTTTQRELVSAPDMEKYAEMLLNHVDFKGVCGLDFRYDPKTGRIAFIEINARFTGGIATPITAGFDIPHVLFSLATTGRFDEKIKVRIGTRTKWILGDIITLVGRLFSLKFYKQEWKNALTFKGFDAFDDYRKDDRRAILGEMSYYWSKLIKNGKLNP